MIQQVFKRLGHLAAIVAFALSFSVTAVQASWEEAGKVIEGATSDVLQLLENEELLKEEQKDQLISEIDTILSPVVDFDYIAKGVMGKYYRRASKEQRMQFSDVFKTTLLKTYAKALVGFKIERYEMVLPRKKSPDEKKQIVTVNVFAADGTKFALIYYMKKSADEWKLVNAVLDGSVNIKLSFKNQFADLMQRNRNNVDKVITSWKDKVDPDKGNA
ncbi:phospholipid-binding protein MlaC [Neptuniibacter sp. QD37_6]|uniref:MlaC/ttg2D family ABC transporter substrate-binding protein n=1 Tax=Neptuniibacter sp. QD37_6 TaxID=3398210 RepID=UPI0039F51CE1